MRDAIDIATGSSSPVYTTAPIRPRSFQLRLTSNISSLSTKAHSLQMTPISSVEPQMQQQPNSHSKTAPPPSASTGLPVNLSLSPSQTPQVKSSTQTPSPLKTALIHGLGTVKIATVMSSPTGLITSPSKLSPKMGMSPQ